MQTSQRVIEWIIWNILNPIYLYTRCYHFQDIYDFIIFWETIVYHPKNVNAFSNSFLRWCALVCTEFTFKPIFFELFSNSLLFFAIYPKHLLYYIHKVILFNVNSSKITIGFKKGKKNKKETRQYRVVQFWQF